ncbi:hypothetical protein ACIBCB_18180 [Streptomyces uncialis]|uniref:hypothetical protein n=1 Tax=Streptomyces uncialis TaxID=1048205 RepID=UPI0037BB751E
MRITPRKEEVATVVALLEDDSFESASHMAKALIKEVGEILQMRDWIALVHTWENGHRGLNFAPFASEVEARSFAAKMAFGGTGRLVKLYSPGVMLANHDGKKWKGYCQNEQCTHAPFTHSAATATRGACQIPICPCMKFQSA